MFKSLMIVAALALAGVAQADTVTLSPAGGAGALHQYHEVATSSGDAVSIYLPQTNGVGGMQFWFDSQYDVPHNHFLSYWIGTYYGNGVMSQAQKCVFPLDAGGNVTGPCQLDGEVALVTLSESTAHRCTHSGRGQHCFTVWSLLGGTIGL